MGWLVEWTHFRLTTSINFFIINLTWALLVFHRRRRHFLRFERSKNPKSSSLTLKLDEERPFKCTCRIPTNGFQAPRKKLYNVLIVIFCVFHFHIWEFALSQKKETERIVKSQLNWWLQAPNELFGSSANARCHFRYFRLMIFCFFASIALNLKHIDACKSFFFHRNNSIKWKNET